MKKKSGYGKRLSRFLKQTKRVIKVASKPKKEEFWAVAKITLLGAVIIGTIGYVITSVSVIFG